MSQQGCTSIWKVILLLIILGCAGSYAYKKIFSYRIKSTSLSINDIRNIGKWEFLSSYQEVNVAFNDTHNFISDNLVVRKYVGTPRVGIDLSEMKEDAITYGEDNSITVVIPPLRLLNDRFIDESKTQRVYTYNTFGSYDDEDMKLLDAALYNKAQAKMYNNISEPSIIKDCERNAISQITAFFKANGYKNVTVKFEEPAAETQAPVTNNAANN